LLAVSVRDVIVCEALAGPCGGPVRVLRPGCGADIDSAAGAAHFVLLALVPSAFRTRNNSSHNS
jgi:hypothetical protein